MTESSRPTLTFYGAAGTVTGSRYLLKTPTSRVLIDCGLFQGLKKWRERNWHPFPEPASSIDGVFLTHAHLDHSGYLPALVKQGFRGPIFATEATYELCKILLADAAKLQEEEAAYNNRHHTSKHNPALPLFTQEDAQQALKLFEPVKNSASFNDLTVTFSPNGHILGSSYLDVDIGGKHIVFSGDLGRPHDIIMNPPEPPCYADYLIMESTYGDRLHDNRDIDDCLADAVSTTLASGGDVLVPAFAIGRAQSVLYTLHKLQRQQKIPYVPIYLDSPMAISATELMIRFNQQHRLSKLQCREMEENVKFLRTVEQSMALNETQFPCIIVSASGMATGGRVLYHLERLLPGRRNTIIFAGYQAAGTRGDRLVRGEDSVKIHGRYYPVKAQILNFDFLSAHAGRDEMLTWLKKIPVAPKHCFITHGEQESSTAFADTINHYLGWNTSTPTLGETIEL
ncbi:MBL fold metallo-hydrolase RNA specificity domain-containing protein [Aurantivibrio plasticivorans]